MKHYQDGKTWLEISLVTLVGVNCSSAGLPTSCCQSVAHSLHSEASSTNLRWSNQEHIKIYDMLVPCPSRWRCDWNRIFTFWSLGGGAVIKRLKFRTNSNIFMQITTTSCLMAEMTTSPSPRHNTTHETHRQVLRNVDWISVCQDLFLQVVNMILLHHWNRTIIILNLFHMCVSWHNEPDETSFEGNQWFHSRTSHDPFYNVYHLIRQQRPGSRRALSSCDPSLC